MEQLLLRPEEAAHALGIGRSAVYDALRTGELESVRIGRSRRIPTEAVERYVERLRELSDEDGQFNNYDVNGDPRP